MSISPPVTRFDFLIDEEEAGIRLDQFLADQDDPPLTRSQVRRSLDAGEVRVNDAQLKAGYKLRPNDQIVWNYSPPPSPDLEPWDTPLEFLYRDPHLAIVNKPAGLVVHPSAGHTTHTLVHALLHHLDALSPSEEPMRPGIVHRIDKDTSGALVITCSDTAQRHLSAKFHDHDITRLYHAIVLDQGLADSGTFDTLHGRDPTHRLRFSSKVLTGRRAITHWQVIERFDQGLALVQCRLETGRTHQIRMHFLDAGCPLLGDQLYGWPFTQDNRLIPRQSLHAYTLGFQHFNGEEIHATAPYPADFQDTLDALRAGKAWRKRS